MNNLKPNNRLLSKLFGLMTLAVSHAAVAAPDDEKTPLVLGTDQIEATKEAFIAASNRRWEVAISKSNSLDSRLARDVIEWLLFSESYRKIDTHQLIKFIRAHRDWPGLTHLRTKLEQTMAADFTPSHILEWFEEYPPVSDAGKLRLGDALLSSGNVELAQKILREAWINGNYPKRQERDFYRRHKHLLSAEDHAHRLDRLLWNKNTRAARRMLSRADDAAKQIAVARIYLIESHPDVDEAIAALPANDLNNAGLIYDRSRWRRIANKDERARELLFSLPEQLIFPEKWWYEIKYQIRSCLKDGLVTDAYRLAANNSQFEVSDRAAANWLAGWIALKFLNQPQMAYQHFEMMHDIVSMPISLGRSSYWAAQAAAGVKNTLLFHEWLRKSAIYSTTFYGQLSGFLLKTDNWAFPEDPVYNIDSRSRFESREVVQVTRLLGQIGAEKLMHTFVLHLANMAKTREEHALIGNLVSDYDFPQIGIAAAKRATRSGVTITKTSYPVPKKYGEWNNHDSKVEQALAMAIARQESEMDSKAISSAGARGLMQLMPRTAKAISKQLGIPFDKRLLVTEPLYNITLGTNYVAALLKDYQGCYALALAAYNAGPARLKRWLRRYGDPRKEEISVIDWIESVPYSETRNYIQGVIETMEVYRVLLERQQSISALHTCG